MSKSRGKTLGKGKIVAGVVVLVLMVAGLIFLFTKSSELVTVQESDVKEQVEEWMGQMNLQDKVGQMIIMTNEEQSLTETFRKELLDVKPGGYILMVPNITTYAQTKRMLSDIDSMSRREFAARGVPMILATDEEGGNVQRLLYVSDKEATNVPYMYDVGEVGDENLALEVGKVIGEEVRSLGLNLTFAPDVDVFTNPNNEVIGRRSFGSDKGIVAKMAVKVAEGIENVGVRTAYKHFPGHGDTAVDSHAALPVLNKNWEELERIELYPFRKAIEAGAEMIMVGHIALFDGGEPASLSKEAVADVLKKKMGFSGLAVTDALNMGAVTTMYTGAEIAVKAVVAGNDLLLMPTDAREARDAIVAAVESGQILEERINESVRKILNYKFKHLAEFTAGREADFGSMMHKEIVQKVFDRLKDKNGEEEK